MPRELRHIFASRIGAVIFATSLGILFYSLENGYISLTIGLKSYKKGKR